MSESEINKAPEGLTPQERRLWSVLLEHEWMSTEKVAEKAGMARELVSPTMTRLRRKCVILSEKRKRPNGHNMGFHKRLPKASLTPSPDLIKRSPKPGAEDDLPLYDQALAQLKVIEKAFQTLSSLLIQMGEQNKKYREAKDLLSSLDI